MLGPGFGCYQLVLARDAPNSEFEWGKGKGKKDNQIQLRSTICDLVLVLVLVLITSTSTRDSRLEHCYCLTQQVTRLKY